MSDAAAIDHKSSASVLIVTDQLPYPPRNGVTLPVYNFAIRLQRNRKLKILLLSDASVPLEPAAFLENESVFGKIRVARLDRKKRGPRVLNELMGREMYNQGWTCNQLDYPASELDADAIIISPYSAVAKYEATGLGSKNSYRVRIAAVSDCTAAEYHLRANQSFGIVTQALKGKLDRLRARQIARIEANSLKVFDHILMQTPTDVALMRRLVSIDLAKRAMPVPNGVNPDLFSLVADSRSTSAVFIAELSSEYAPVAEWLVREVWPQVSGACPNARLVVVGRGASAPLKDLFRETPGVTHIDFAKSLSDIYRQAAVAVCPVFKGYGLINKTIEAMAAGLPVVGGIEAFNGIVGFVNGEHGIACQPKEARGFADAIASLISSSESRSRIGAAARALVSDQFRWESALHRIEALLDCAPARSL